MSALFNIKSSIAAVLSTLQGENGTQKVGHLPSGSGAIATNLFEELRRLQKNVIVVNDAPFYAKGDGVADDYAAILSARNEARAKKATLRFTKGVYAHSQPLDFGESFEEVVFDAGVTLKYTGSGQYGVTFDAGPNSGDLRYAGSFGWGCPPLIQASNATIAPVYVRSWHHGKLDFICNAATSKVLRVDFAVCTDFRVIASANHGPWVARPVIGIELNKRNAGEYVTDCTFHNPIIEGVSGDGIVANGAQYNLFLGGTTEGNGGAGYSEGPECLRNVLFNVFCEANGNKDFYLNGSAAYLFNCTGGSAGQGLQVLGPRNVIRDCQIKKIAIESTATDTVMDGVAHFDSASGGGFVDNGVRTIKRNVRAETSNGYVSIPDKSQKPKLKRVGGMVITGASKQARCILTIPDHNLDWGDSISVGAVVGMTQLNGNTYTVEPIDNNFAYILSGGVYVNSTGYGTYSGGGGATITPFQNAWTHFGGAFEAASFSKSAEGFVCLAGVVKAGAGNTSEIFTLPTGYRPAKDHSFIVSNSNTSAANAVVYVDTAGRVYFMYGSAAAPMDFVSLGGIQFPAQ